MKLAYLILAHADPRHLQRLIGRLHRDAGIFVHLDRKSPAAPFREQSYGSARMTFVEPRHTVWWGGFSMVEATMTLLRAALSAGSWDYFVLLSGADYPIRPQDEFIDFLRDNRGREFVRLLRVRDSALHLHGITTHFYFDAPAFLPSAGILPRAVRYLRKKARDTIGTKSLDPGVEYFFGSQWWGLTRECAEFVLSEYARRDDLRTFYRTAIAPDEHMIHTLVGNSRYLERAEEIRLAQITAPLPTALGNFHLIDPSLAKTYELADLGTIAGSEKWFARKFSSTRSGSLLDEIDKRICAGARR